MNEHKNNRDRHDNRGADIPLERNALIELTKNEQEHRHALQEKQQKANNVSYFFGMICGTLYHIFLLIILYKIFSAGDRNLVVKIFAINAILIATCFALLSFSRKLSFRKNFNRNSDNTRRNNKRF